MKKPPHLILFLIQLILLITTTIQLDQPSTNPLTTAHLSELDHQHHNETSDCPPLLAPKCTCGKVLFGITKRPTFVTNCTNAGFSGSAQLYLQQVPEVTEVVIMIGNNFTELTANLLNHTEKHSSLIQVDLSNNHIRTIHGKAFHCMKSVEVLILNHNNLSLNQNALEPSAEHPRMFASLRNLEELHLRSAFDRTPKNVKSLMSQLGGVFRQSNISTLKLLNLEQNGLKNLGSDEQLFCLLPELQKLHLGGNELTRYSINGSCLKYLSLVDVSSNLIPTIDRKSLDLIKSVPHIGSLHLNMSGNPFKCDCSLIDFFRFVRNATSESADPKQSPKLEQLNQFRCSRASSPVDIKGKYFDDLDEQDFGDCGNNPTNPKADPKVIAERSEAVRRNRHYIALSYFILVLLCAILVSLLGFLVHTNREFLTNTWNYFLMEFNPKSEYTALDKDGPSENASESFPSSRPGPSKRLSKGPATKKKHIRMREESEEGGVAEEQV